MSVRVGIGIIHVPDFTDLGFYGKTSLWMCISTMLFQIKFA